MLDAKELMTQAHMTAHAYMHQAIKSIDDAFGEGYAHEHPELVGAFMRSAATCFLATFLSNELSSRLDRIADALE